MAKSEHRTKTYLVIDLKNWAASLGEHGIGSIDPEVVKVEYFRESSLGCTLKVTDATEGTPRYYEIRVREHT